jgi:hypothetical protein
LAKNARLLRNLFVLGISTPAFRVSSFLQLLECCFLLQQRLVLVCGFALQAGSMGVAYQHKLSWFNLHTRLLPDYSTHYIHRSK